MDIRHIRYFRTVATHQNFSKAAYELGISQPPLSIQIRQLEDEIGVELFYRSSHGATLTDAGHALYKATEQIEKQLHQAIEITQRTANGELGELHLGFTGTAILNPIVPKAIKQFQKIYPEINLILQEANSLLLIDALIQKKLDIAVIRTPDEYPEQICIQPLVYENLVAAVPSHSKYNQQSNLELHELKDEFFIVSPYEVSAGLHDVTLLACRQSGFEPKFGPSAPQIVSILSLVAANLGVSLVPESTQQVKIKGIQYCKLPAHTPKVSLGLAYQHNYHCQPAINFSSILHSMLHKK